MSIAHRPLLAAAVALIAGMLASVNASGATTDSPPPVTASDLVFTERALYEGDATEAGLVPEYADEIVPNLRTFLAPGEDRSHPSFSGAVVLAASHGMIVEHAAIGDAVRYARLSDGEPEQLPQDERVPATTETIFDLASVTKLFTAVAALSLADDGLLDFEAPVVDYLPEFAISDDGDEEEGGEEDDDKRRVTVAQLLNHTSGLPAFIPLQSEGDNYAERIDAVLTEPLRTEPGEKYVYSDLNLITLGKIVEEVAGDPLDVVVARRITEPLGMTDTMFNPPRNLRGRIAATTVNADGMIRGKVHDPNARALNGVAGHAGVFSTASDMAVFAQMILNGGAYGGQRVLSEDAVREIFTNENAGLGDDAARGRGFQLDQRYYMGALSSPVTAGHTGYTGTSLVIDPLSESFVVLLTNRVHPTAAWGRSSVYRRSVAGDLARAIPVEPSTGPDAWFSGRPEGGVSTLTAPLGRATLDGRVGFRIWYDTSDQDGRTAAGTLLASSDGETFEQVPLELSADGHSWTAAEVAGFSGRRWLQARAELPDGTTQLRWRYETRSGADQSRGIYLDHIRVADGWGRIFNSQSAADAEQLLSDGWFPSAN